jgi:hypothetical protein
VGLHPLREEEVAVRFDPTDPEVALRPKAAADLGPLFEPPPERVSVTDLTAVRYTRWRVTPDGGAVFDWVERKALELAAAGERRIGSKSLVERARDDLHIKVNNLYTANLARELILRHPHLKDHFELRERTAA